MRNKFATICADIVKNDKDAVILIGDISHYLLQDAQEFAPERFFNIGICEQSTINVAAGMSLEGLRPIVHTIAPFVVERAYEQIKIGLGYQNTDVTIITVGGTYDYADLGCTHHCYSDIALMRNIQIGRAHV
jgi:transketolase